VRPTGNAVKHQALVMGFSDTFAVIALAPAIAAVAVAFTRKASAVGGAAAHCEYLSRQ
jgi:DHA2 family multidrug resistance protein